MIHGGITYETVRLGHTTVQDKSLLNVMGQEFWKRNVHNFVSENKANAKWEQSKRDSTPVEQGC